MVEPKTGTIAAATVMTSPENNSVAIGTFAKALKRFTRVNCLVYDRMCKLKKAASKKNEFKRIKFWAVDKFHGTKHGESCECNPEYVRALKARVAKVNTVVCE